MSGSKLINLYTENRHHIAFVGFFSLMVGLVASRTLLSISMMLLVGIAFLNPKLKQSFKRFVGHPAALALTGYFVIYLFYGFNAHDSNYYLERLRIKLPFLILPFTFLALPRFRKKQWILLLYSFVIIISIGALGSLIYYILHYTTITQSYRLAKVIPTPISHIRFSLMIAFATAISFYLGIKKVTYRWPNERFVSFGMALFLFLFLHILAVRSGILAFYGVVFYGLLYAIIKHKKILSGILGISLLICIPVIAYYTIPSFKNKINYAKWDLKMYMKGKQPTSLSDSRRLISLNIGWKLGKENPFVGVGLGNLKSAAHKEYQNKYPSIQKRIMPHNQFVFMFAGAGSIGLAVFSLAFFYPVFYKNYYKNPLYAAFNIIIFTSLLVEATFETQIGTAFYLSFLLLFLKRFKTQ